MIAVLADDLSGAAELANIAANRGLHTEVHIGSQQPSDAEVLVVATNTRTMSATAAVGRVTRWYQNNIGADYAFVFQKVDSILRGHIAAEANAALFASDSYGCGLERVLLVPANPTKSRTIVGGVYFVDGKLLHETALADDEEFPIHTSDVTKRLGTAWKSIPANSSLNELSASDRYLVGDSATVQEVAHWASLVTPKVLAVGAADFFAALLDRHTVQKPISIGSSPTLQSALLVCGSKVGWQARQRQAIEHNIEIECMPAELREMNATDDVAEQWADSLCKTFANRKRLCIAIGDEPSNSTADPRVLVKRLGTAVRRVLKSVSVDQVYLEGGATAAAVLSRFSSKRYSVSAGEVAILRPLESATPAISIKPGSYDWPNEVWAALSDA